MNTIEKRATLIRVDKVSIELTKKGLQNRADLISKFVELCEKTLKTSFTDKEKINLKDNGLSFVNDWIKPKFKFPDADENFNLKALGMDLTPITNYWNANAKQWNGLSVELDKGKFFIPNMDKLENVTKHYHYAENERQEKAFKEATEICKNLNRMMEKKFIIDGKQKDLTNAFNFVRYGTQTNINDHSERKFFPTEWLILKL